MNKRELKKFEELLKHQQDLLLQNLKNLQDVVLIYSKHSSGDNSNIPTHTADISSETVSQNLALGLMENEQIVIKEINVALQKIKNGTYGICEHCNEPISKNRLEYIPYTKMCIICKTKEEKLHKRF